MVPDLEKGRTRTVDYPGVRPVSDEVVDMTLPFLPSPVEAMVRLQRLTGMRPGEVRVMRLCDIDRSRDVWRYIPWEHKTEHHDLPRQISLGLKGQSILTPYLMDKEGTPEAWLFSPREASAERVMEMRRRFPKFKPGPKRTVGDQYSDSYYWWEIDNAAKKAGVPHWSPNQLRHTALTAIRAKEGLDAAQVMANHKNVKTTEIYAERDSARADELALKYG
jgi:integrase